MIRVFPWVLVAVSSTRSVDSSTVRVAPDPASGHRPDPFPGVRVRKPVGEEDVHAQGARQFPPGATGPGAEVHDAVRAASGEGVAEPRQERGVVVAEGEEELQVVGEGVAQRRRAPWLIVNLEQMEPSHDQE